MITAGMILPSVQVVEAQVRDSAQATAAAPRSTGPELSGVIFTTYRYGGGRANRSDNRFDVDRAYINVRAPAGDRMSIRITADVYQQRTSGNDDYYRGWTLRAKYAYADYRLGTFGDLPVSVRLGMLQTTVIEHVESYWIRGLSSTAVELSGFFSSSDVGAAAHALLPNRLGEIYTGVYNGEGYTSRERDRFKDYGARLTLTPFANGSGILKTFAISPWYYVGARASDYAAGAGTVLPVPDARQKNRLGVFTGIRDPRATIGLHYGLKADEVESADTTADTAPLVAGRDASLLSAFAILKPGQLGLGILPRNLLAVIRHDYFKADVDEDGYRRFLIGGLGWQLTSKATVFVDWQRTTAGSGAAAADESTFFIHGIINY